MADKEALEILNDNFARISELVKTFPFGGDAEDAIRLSVRALAEKVAKEGE